MTAFRTRDLRDAPFILVLVIAAGGLAFSTFHWRRGVEVVGLAVVLGGVLRAVLTERQAGLLAVRHRNFDVSCYLALGVAVIVVGLLLPHG
jgi:Protein of unknown function (DUF3017)